MQYIFALLVVAYFLFCLPLQGCINEPMQVGDKFV